MTKRAQHSELASSDAAYRRFGIERGRVAQHEDGRRTGDGKGEFEWWYLDAKMDDGSTMVIAFFTKDVKGGFLPAHIEPLATFELDLPDGTHYDDRVEPGAQNFSAARDRCDVAIGDCTIKGNLTTYNVEFRGEKVSASVRLVGSVPAWRPETGTTTYGDDGSLIFGWMPAVPEGRIEADVTVAGRTMHFSGTGYHDHNWGNAPMMNLLNHWYWGRAKIGPYVVISSYLVAQRKYGYGELPVFMLARDGELVADDALRCLSFSVPKRHDDPKTGQPIADRLVYDYRDGDVEYRIVYDFDQDLLQERMVDMLPPGVAKFGAKLIRFDGAYHRMAGTATIEKLVRGQVEERHSAPAVWEQMFFGKTPRDRAC